MKNIEKIVENIEKLQKAKMPNDEIKSILELEDEPNVVLEQYNELKDLKNAEATAELLQEGIKKKGTYNYHKVLRLVREGALKPVEDKPSKKIGYRFHINEINRFIEESNMTSDDWKNKVSELEKQIEKLRAENEKVKAQNTSLKSKNKKLTDAQKEANK